MLNFLEKSSYVHPIYYYFLSKFANLVKSAKTLHYYYYCCVVIVNIFVIIINVIRTIDGHVEESLRATVGKPILQDFLEMW